MSTQDQAKTKLTEDLCIGFRLVWEYNELFADVTAYEVEGWEGKTPLFAARPELTPNHEGTKPYLSGFVKWDGCSELNQGCPHWCGAHFFKKHCALLEHIYNRAMALMNSNENPW